MLSKNIAVLFENYDPYSFMDAYDSMDEAIASIQESLYSSDKGILEYLEAITSDDDFKEEAKKLINEVMKIYY